MKYISTRALAMGGDKTSYSLSQAINQGLAKDGGLLVPAFLPKIDKHLFDHQQSFFSFCEILLQPFFNEDALATHLSSIIKNTFTFEMPLKKIDESSYLLELFHGPTLSFKDVGARFLAACLDVISKQEKTTIMVATSGDTGSAVASAFHNKANIEVIILYPQGKISERQAQQITCWDKNILALAVKGNFDDCQRLVKSAFKDPWWQARSRLNSANSINIGRLLAQMCYYAYTSFQFYHAQQIAPGFIIPTGNLGNALACFWAKAMGFPIREIVLATNSNRSISDYLLTGKYQPRVSVPTLANAMDVGNPSNFERLQYLFKDFEIFKQEVKAISVDDRQITKTIQQVYQKHGAFICPHTATAYFARQQLSEGPWILLATAHAAKFETVNALLPVPLPIPKSLAEMLKRKQNYQEIEACLTALRSHPALG